MNFRSFKFEKNRKRLGIKTKICSRAISADWSSELVDRFLCPTFYRFSNLTVRTALSMASIFDRLKIHFRFTENDRLSIKQSKMASFHLSL